MHGAPVIGYYVHHQGSGHAHRALSISRSSRLPITGLSSAPPPHGWAGDWVRLADDAGGDARQVTAGGRLHYVPERHPGLRDRMSTVADWIRRTDPALLVADVSVEVALLARLHGVSVVTMAMPGQRDDPAHRLGYDIAESIAAPWPAAAGALWSATPADLAKACYLGAISRFSPARADRPPARTDWPRRQVVVLNGTGGAGPTPTDIARAAAATPGWDWIHLDRAHGFWVEDPWPVLCSAAVVVSHAGQNAVAEIAAARRPAVVIPQPRPFAEQQTMAAALTALQLPALVRPCWPEPAAWPELLAAAAALDGAAWSRWNDGLGADRAAELLARLVLDVSSAVSA